MLYKHEIDKDADSQAIDNAHIIHTLIDEINRLSSFAHTHTYSSMLDRDIVEDKSLTNQNTKTGDK